MITITIPIIILAIIITASVLPRTLGVPRYRPQLSAAEARWRLQRGSAIGSARCPGGTQSACESAVQNLNFVLHFFVPHFCTTLFSTSLLYYTFQYLTSALHFSLHALTFPHCTSLPAFTFFSTSLLHFRHFLAFTFLHFTSCTYWVYTPLFKDFPLEGVSFLGWGRARS